ncbi:MAG: hypothetical protein AMXMBFR12_04130 [Candidatus Babeliales bacterium]
MKRTFLLSLALLSPITAVKALEPATAIALSGPAIYALTNDCFDAASSITNRALLSAAFAATAKMCANGMIAVLNQPHTDKNFFKLMLLGVGSFVTGGLACIGTEGCIRELLREANQKNSTR